MPAIVVFPPYYVGVAVCGGFAVYLRIWMRQEERRGAAVHPRRGLTAVFVLLLVLTGVFGALTAGEVALASTWVYHYYLGVEEAGPGSHAIVLPVPVDTSLLTGLQANRTSANWSLVQTIHGPGLYVAFSGPTTFESAVRMLAPLGNHPDGGLAPQLGNQTSWEVWIEYLGADSVNVNFQYGYGYTVAGAAAYIGALTPGWSSYPLTPAP